MPVARRTGRPTKPAKPGTRVSLGLKVTPQTKALIDRSARQHGRTQSQEAEARIEQAFQWERILKLFSDDLRR